MINKKPVYIMSLEASDIYYHQHREMQLKREYLGMIPFSLELLKLQDVGLKTTYIEQRDKYISNDVINVKFNSKVRNADEMTELYTEKLEHAKESRKKDIVNYLEELSVHKYDLNNIPSYWDEIKIDDLREELYINGFQIKFVNNRTGSIKIEEYVVYKRSSAKSRTGQCLFIKKKLYNKMIKWSRMGIPFRKGQQIDLASLLAYESLVGSSLEDTINIDVNKILIVDDVDSKFKRKCNVVKSNKKTGYLDSFTEDCEVVNSLFDGESLLESKYFKQNQGMILLRNHMFKSASFNCEIQKFLKDKCPDGMSFNEWQLENMFGEKMFAKNIEMICTPSSLKALKFSHALPTKSDVEMWNHWKKVVIEDGNIFGICKNEKKSKIGSDENGEVLQQTSYQMINCLPAKREDIDELTKIEVQYIMKLKTDDDFLMNEIYKKRDETNSNQVIYDLFQHNNNIINTKLFKDFKYKFISKQVAHAKKGKIKVKGDYCVLLGNPVEFLYHAIGQWNKKDILDLNYNEVHTTLYDFNKELVGFRNPNTSPSNVLVMTNKSSSQITNYFNLTDNIVAVNAIDFAIQDILSGCDYDSDTMLVSSEASLVELGKKCFEHYLPCVNHIEGEKKKYKLSTRDHFEIDKQLSLSQMNIGKVVNLGQLCMSTYWDLINNKNSGEHVDELLKKVDVMTVLSGIAIDMAKKFYAIDMDAEINFVAKNSELAKKKKKPNFWVFVSQNKKTKNKVEMFDCPMDYLMKSLSELTHTTKEQSVHFDYFLEDFTLLNVNTRQIKNLKTLLDSYTNDIKQIFSSGGERELLYKKVEYVSSSYIKKMKNWKLQEPTIAYAIRQTYIDGDNLLLKLLKLLYESHPEILINCVKKC